mgnify:FL=1|jgi:tRNA (guanine-N7-)-methyltransferase|eukprot:g8454.t1
MLVVTAGVRRFSSAARQHLNPLSFPLSSLEIDVTKELEYFVGSDRMHLPFHLDLGCAKGRYLLNLAERHQDVNFIGLEIKSFSVKSALQNRDNMGRPNLHYINANLSAMNDSFLDFLKAFPANGVQSVSINHPDPCFKSRHEKRRMVNGKLVQHLGLGLDSNTIVYTQTDVQMVHDYMAAEFNSTSLGRQHFQPLTVDELKAPPVWFTEEEANAYPIVEPGHVSLTKHWDENGEGGTVESIPIKHFFGMPTDHEMFKMDPAEFPSCDGVIWRQGFRKV